MRVPDIFLNSVGFVVSYPAPNIYDVEATGFFVAVPSAISTAHQYLVFVTAAHVALELQTRDIGILVNRSGGGVIELKTTETWHTHPSDPSVDIAAVPFEGSDEFDITAIAIDKFLSPESMKDQTIGIGDEVFLPGLFYLASGLSDGGAEPERIMPIIRHGNIAMLPKQKIFIDIGPKREAAEMYLIEARSIGGISGSPVFARKTIRVPVEHPTTREQSHIHGLGDLFLLGVMHGHWDIKESEMNRYRFTQDSQRGVNLGIATVVPAHRVLEVINHPSLVKDRNRMDREFGNAITPHPDGV